MRVKCRNKLKMLLSEYKICLAFSVKDHCNFNEIVNIYPFKNVVIKCLNIVSIHGGTLYMRRHQVHSIHDILAGCLAFTAILYANDLYMYIYQA